MLLGLILVLVSLGIPATVRAEGRIPSNCIALSRADDAVRHLHARVVLPMHWFSPEGLARFLVQLNADYTIVVSQSAEIVISRDNLPLRPEVVVLQPALFP